jgi:hypothetical protein
MLPRVDAPPASSGGDADTSKGETMRKISTILAVAGLATTVAAATAMAALGPFGAWSQAVRVEADGGADPSFNGAGLDGCPFVARDGKTFYMASNRLTGAGDTVNDINIWVSTRARQGDVWGAPTLVGAPVSIDTAIAGDPVVNDFCPTIDRDGQRFFFVSNRTGADAFGTAPCGSDDIYVTRFRGDGSIEAPRNLGCDVNTSAGEASPFPLANDGVAPTLYFSSTLTGSGDLYRSRWVDGVYTAREQVPGVNTPTFVESQPNVRRDGLELFYFSNAPGGQGGNDIWTATRASTADGFSGAHALGAEVNTAAAETRPSLSWDGTTLYFGSTRTGGGAEGSSDLYLSTRSRE